MNATRILVGRLAAQLRDLAVRIRDVNSAQQYLTFLAANEQYGIDILRIQEIRRWQVAVPTPDAPTYVLGVLDLRGAAVPIIDLGKLLGRRGVAPGPRSVVAVATIRDEGRERTAAFAVDAVLQACSIGATAIQSRLDIGAHIPAEYMHGIATVDNKRVTLLRVDELVSADVIDSAIADVSIPQFQSSDQR